MSTQFFSRPSAGYTGEAGLSNRTKYNDDSTASPRRPINSTKVDGDFNYLIDAVNILYDTAVSGVVADNSITDVKLRDSAGLSVIGRAANSSGNPADIVAASDNQVLRRSGTSIGFGQVATAGVEDAAITAVKIADTNVTFTKLQNVNTGVVLGRSSSGAGSVEALSVNNGLAVSGGALSGVAATDTTSGVVELATTAEVTTGTDTARAVTPASIVGHQGIVKAWAAFDGTALGSNPPTDGYNISTVQRNSTGNYTITFATARPNANYAVSGSANFSLDPCSFRCLSKSTTTFTVVTTNNGGAADLTLVNVMVCGD